MSQHWCGIRIRDCPHNLTKSCFLFIIMETAQNTWCHGENEERSHSASYSIRTTLWLNIFIVKNMMVYLGALDDQHLASSFLMTCLSKALLVISCRCTIRINYRLHLAMRIEKQPKSLTQMCKALSISSFFRTSFPSIQQNDRETQGNTPRITSNDIKRRKVAHSTKLDKIKCIIKHNLLSGRVSLKVLQCT